MSGLLTNKDLENLFRKGDRKGLPQECIKKIRVRLEAIDSVSEIEHLKGLYGLHRLGGDREGTWSVKLTGNWRMTFQFRDGSAYDVDIEDYH
jgi:toxin HigB-1